VVVVPQVVVEHLVVVVHLVHAVLVVEFKGQVGAFR